ncbi:TonB-dependent siderophore receptor [Sphingomonas sp. BK580]|uniref:TonB-dependent siderophore receptor n=1 Tax=Sphingomonas sp. BK580 TaxID=2586972 RepID=UPI0016095782|nr:TonB-dependent siderophore receptor [Sphingomonas sp. BK580]MBB3693524.1 iron complex outermembrane receptor protein [Sphingomonas sp. BK580]
MLRIHLLAGVAAPCLLLAIPAAAQAQNTSSATSDVTTVQSWTGDIIVTGARETYTAPETSAATRTDTPLIQVPQSIQVLTRTLIQEQDRRTLGDALVNVSGVTPTRSDEVLFIPPVVRGFPAEVYLDGLSVFAGNQQAYDPNSLVGIERIDVLKGPTATLYGGGIGTPLGGVINLESVRPNDKPGGYLAMRAGSFSTWNPYGDINVPLADGIAARITGEYQSNDGWIDKVKARRWSVQPSLSFQIDPATDLLLQGQFSRRSNLEYSGLPADAALAGTIHRDAFPGSPIDQPLTTNDIRMGQATLRHAFADRLKLTVSGRYYSSMIDEQGSFVYPGLAPTETVAPLYDVFPITMRNRTKEATVDANLAGDVDLLGGTHKLLVGVNYDWTSFYSAMGLFVSDSPSGTIDLSNPSYDLLYTPQLPVNSYTDDRFTTFAGYIQDQATYGPLHLTGGLRLTSLKFVENSNIGVANDKTYTHLSPRIGATLDVVKGIALFAGYATAFRAPFGFIGRQAPVPETSSNFEGGVKLALAGTGLSGTIAVFRQTHDNVVTADPASVGFYVQSGRQRARGVEVDMVWEPTPAFSLLANYAYTDTRDDGVAHGDRLIRVPKSSGRISARYRVLHGPAKGLALGAGISAFTSRELTLPNTIAVPGYAAIDAQASYDIGRFTLGASVVNLGNRRSFDPYSYLGYPVVAPNQPRSAYVTLKVRI